ncbi:hypothetical protein QBC32DRAFT_349727 [Pseudoneurospora amorphoporcata]|uniref:Uncharacterized protein n=1 Tax=Pseudoneurospora amorphoporcata TaxID=241081 RepID=A0AAN6NNN5_9PEZI|nr:hypothetical protein QBC32DRAFT_349727 [Pseudoneurospora amorphoporcata]
MSWRVNHTTPRKETKMKNPVVFVAALLLLPFFAAAVPIPNPAEGLVPVELQDSAANLTSRSVSFSNLADLHEFDK